MSQYNINNSITVVCRSEGGAVGGDSPPTEVKPEERVSVFKSREELGN